MRKDGIPAENAQGRPRSPRCLLRLLALLLAALGTWIFDIGVAWEVG